MNYSFPVLLDYLLRRLSSAFELLHGIFSPFERIWSSTLKRIVLSVCVNYMLPLFVLHLAAKSVIEYFAFAAEDYLFCSLAFTSAFAVALTARVLGGRKKVKVRTRRQTSKALKL